MVQVSQKDLAFSLAEVMPQIKKSRGVDMAPRTFKKERHHKHTHTDTCYKYELAVGLGIWC